jgi:hypothetical protein
MAPLFFEELADSQTASVASRKIILGHSEILATIDGTDPMAHYLAASMYLFHAQGAACKDAILFLTTTP